MVFYPKMSQYDFEYPFTSSQILGINSYAEQHIHEQALEEDANGALKENEDKDDELVDLTATATALHALAQASGVNKPKKQRKRRKQQQQTKKVEEEIEWEQARTRDDIILQQPTKIVERGARTLNKNNTSGVKGVDLLKRTNKWRVRYQGKGYGYFDRYEDAVACANHVRGIKSS